MAWELLPVNFTDAVWSGLKRYNEVNNEDGTVSFQDVTVYSNKETSFFGAKNANQMNEALNTLMSMVENGTDLYEAFQIYFNEQKSLFESEAEEVQAQLQADFMAWFETLKVVLDEETATNLYNLITTHTSNVNNPHAVTAAQVGAATSSALESHTNNRSNPHAVTAAQIGAATAGALTSHTSNRSNPHAVTLAQAGVTAGTEELTAGESALATGRMYVTYE